MAKSIINKKIKKSCDYCFFGRKSSAFDNILCKFKGPVSAENYCRNFKYDPIKRIPKSAADIPQFTKEDFEL